jgi:2,3-bisphosphoglycerate-dependent phosphoglycerate mutase
VIYFVRHAHAAYTADGNRPLSENGYADARRVAKILSAYPIKAIYSSPARRAQETITPLAAHFSLLVHIVDDLQERRLAAEPVADFLGTVKMLWEKPNFALPGGESNKIAQARGVAVVKKLAAKHQHVVFSTHGNLLALILHHFDSNVDFAFWQSVTMPDIYALDGKRVVRLWVLSET